MKRMSTNEIRQYWLDYFGKHGHAAVASSSLVPVGDPTLLLINAGMNQFKDLFLGLEKRDYNRAATSQKCMRVSGKHNDLENVGPSPRHHTFFEMLGNFSFGDYFKRDAIRFAWDLLVTQLGLPVERLWFTVYLDDDEAERLWIETGADPSRVLRFGKKDNWWAMGDTGPCGPCSEIHYYWGDLDKQVKDGVNKDDEYLEIWNLVFMQYDQKPTGELVPLPKPSVDTGAGLERLASILQGKDNNYDTDAFTPIMDCIQELARHSDEQRQEHLYRYRAIADHARACTFMIGDGVLPGNEGREYVLRMILRRAARFGKIIGFDQPFLASIADVVIGEMGGHYTDLPAKRDYILLGHHQRGGALPPHADQRPAHPGRVDGNHARRRAHRHCRTRCLPPVGHLRLPHRPDARCSAGQRLQRGRGELPHAAGRTEGEEPRHRRRESRAGRGRLCRGVPTAQGSRRHRPRRRALSYLRKPGGNRDRRGRHLHCRPAHTFGQHRRPGGDSAAGNGLLRRSRRPGERHRRTLLLAGGPGRAGLDRDGDRHAPCDPRHDRARGR
jgi:hypothetical protein